MRSGSWYCYFFLFFQNELVNHSYWAELIVDRHGTISCLQRTWTFRYTFPPSPAYPTPNIALLSSSKVQHNPEMAGHCIDKSLECSRLTLRRASRAYRNLDLISNAIYNWFHTFFRYPKSYPRLSLDLVILVPYFRTFLKSITVLKSTCGEVNRFCILKILILVAQSCLREYWIYSWCRVARSLISSASFELAVHHTKHVA